MVSKRTKSDPGVLDCIFDEKKNKDLLLQFLNESIWLEDQSIVDVSIFKTDKECLIFDLQDGYFHILCTDSDHAQFLVQMHLVCKDNKELESAGSELSMHANFEVKTCVMFPVRENCEINVSEKDKISFIFSQSPGFVVKKGEFIGISNKIKYSFKYDRQLFRFPD